MMCYLYSVTKYFFLSVFLSVLSLSDWSTPDPIPFSLSVSWSPSLSCLALNKSVWAFVHHTDKGHLHLWGLSCFASQALFFPSQDGGYSFSLESVKVLMRLMEMDEIAMEARMGGRPIPPHHPPRRLLCSNPTLPQELKPVCLEPHSDEIFARFGRCSDGVYKEWMNGFWSTRIESRELL